MSWTRTKYIHIIIASVLTIGVGGMWYFQRLTDPFYWLMLTIVAWATLIFYFFQSKYLLQSIFFTVAFTSGVYGFSTQAYSNYSLINSVYSTFRLFLLDVDNVFTKTGSNFFKLPLSIEIARWSAAFYTVSTFSLLFFRYFGQTLKANWVRFRGNHILIFGYSNHAAILIENLAKDGYRVAIVEEKLSDEERMDIYESGAAYFTGNSLKTSVYKKSALTRAKHILLMDQEDSKNLDNYLSISNYLNEQNIDNIVQLFIHIKNKKSEQILENIVKDSKKGQTLEKMRTRVFNSYQLHAEKLLEKNPLHTGYEESLRKFDGNSLHLLFIGFGKMNQHLAHQALHRTHYISNQKIKVTVFDRNIKKVQKDWNYLAPFASKVANCTFKSLDLDYEKVNDQLGLIEKPTHVFISLYDDYLDMIEGLQLIQSLKDVPIFIKMQDNRILSDWLQENESEYLKVKRYNFLREVLTFESVVEGEVQRMAEIAHENYRELKENLGKGEERAWVNLDEFKRESNRYQMLHGEIKLMLMGLTTTDQSGERSLSLQEFNDHVKPLVETMAKVEKERWNAFYYLKGWSTLPLEQVTPDYKDDSDKKVHGCLVSWDELDEVSKKAQVNFKEYDIDTIYNLYHYFTAQGLKIIKGEKE
ncbi:potassium channel family protein [Priestia megaterium]